MVKKCMDVKLNVKPVFVFAQHKYYYEGPCRMAGGEALQPGVDSVVNGMLYQFMMGDAEKFMPECVNLMEPVMLEGSDDWDIKDSYFEELLKDREEVDMYLALPFFPANMVFEEFAMRCKKPICIMPDVWEPARMAGLYSQGVELICEMTWEKVKQRMIILRAKKAIAKANLLLVSRFTYDLPVAGATDSFFNLRDVTEKLGTHFRTVNMHEFLDMLHPLTEEGNYTTPGRITPNITEDEIAELEDMADELLAGAEEADVEKKFLVNSLIGWKVTQKMMDEYDCCGAVIPCPDMCSTRRINKEQLTFCMTHSLNLEQGIPSACEYDVAAAVTMIAEICISGKAPYMGNTLPVVSTNGAPINLSPLHISEEEYAQVEDKENLYVMFHSTPHRKFNGIKEVDNSYALRHFAYDSGFGAIFRHNFDENKGQTITLARISADMKRMFLCKGTIVKSIGYDQHNCNGGFMFHVDDVEHVYKAQCKSGLHLPLIFGDYTEELKLLAAEYEMEVIGL